MASPEIAAFDLDGTVTEGDCFVPFLRRVAGGWPVARTLVRRAPLAARARADRARRDDLKAALVADLLRGRDAAGVSAEGAAFADEVVARQLRRDVAARLRWHRERSHEVVLVTASLALYAEPIGERLGVDAVLATELVVDEAGRLTGTLAGANCRGAEKVRRLRARYGPDVVLAWAYGNSPDDGPMLEASRRPVSVDRRALTEQPA